MNVLAASSAPSLYPASPRLDWQQAGRAGGSFGRSPGGVGNPDDGNPEVANPGGARSDIDSPAGDSPEDARLVESLKARDREVRAHEQAHLAAAGGLAVSAAIFSYQRGPDGVNYAIGGEVRIDTSPGRTPEETISRAQTIRSAALAPAEPSGQDRAVAAEASRMESEARAELAAQEKARSAGPGEEAADGEAAGLAASAAATGATTAEAAAVRQARVAQHYRAGAPAQVGSQIDVAA